MPTDYNSTPNILFFSPEAGVNPHFAAQCVLARTLAEMGHKVLFARCVEIFARCPVMDMHQLPYACEPKIARQTCIQCAKDSVHMLDAYGLECIDLRCFYDAESQAEIKTAITAAPDDLRDFTFDSIPFGYLVVMDLALSNKVYDLEELDEKTRFAWLKYIEASLQSYVLVKKLHKAIPVSQLVHFNDYSLLLGARLAAEKAGVRVHTITLASHQIIDRRRFVFWSDVGSITLLKQGDAWRQWRELALPATRVQEIADDILIRMGAKGAHVYSPSKTFDGGDLHSRIGLDRNKKLLVAFTSSLDEMVATTLTRKAMGFVRPASRQPFADQIEWLEALSAFVGNRADMQLAVRIHPREGANKRDRKESQHLSRLTAKFTKDLPNCRFFWPEDKISSYDLGEIADLALTSWSTIGLEMARLGVPVLACSKGLAALPPDDFLEGAETSQEYFERLIALLHRPMNAAIIAHAYRWYNLLHLGTSLDLGDLVPTRDFNGLPEFRLPAEASVIQEIIVDGKDVLEINRVRLIDAQHSQSTLEEELALKRQLRRIIYYLFTGQDRTADFRLVVSRGDAPQSPPRCDADGCPVVTLNLHDDSLVTLVDADQTRTRYSPMCRRLAPLCSDSLVDEQSPLSLGSTAP